MRSYNKKYLLVGGTRNGEYYETYLSRPPLTILIRREITLVQFEKLKISDTIMHCPPDDRYQLHTDDTYHYDGFVSYIPGGSDEDFANP